MLALWPMRRQIAEMACHAPAMSGALTPNCVRGVRQANISKLPWQLTPTTLAARVHFYRHVAPLYELAQGNGDAAASKTDISCRLNDLWRFLRNAAESRKSLDRYVKLLALTLRSAILETGPIRTALVVGRWGREPAPDGTTPLKFRRLLECNKLREQLFAKVGEVRQGRGLKVDTGNIVDVTIIGVPSSTKNADKARNPEMDQTKKSERWHFGMKLHIDADSQTGLTHSAVVAAANVHDKHLMPALPHSAERRTLPISACASAVMKSITPDARRTAISRRYVRGSSTSLRWSSSCGVSVLTEKSLQEVRNRAQSNVMHRRKAEVSV
ncbi:protein of unknown function [Paraburkholderia dioscoreae]|uniref:Transposase IS4-like domain-containing protein n=1 Tax=Paraburkholderia dioscoreae TaxID=2604047 RepID=A0A5Q4ZHH7_9BURK|nr:protein of unknown function [Paraburkholderia dioscoreae]